MSPRLKPVIAFFPIPCGKPNVRHGALDSGSGPLFSALCTYVRHMVYGKNGFSRFLLGCFQNFIRGFCKKLFQKFLRILCSIGALGIFKELPKELLLEFPEEIQLKFLEKLPKEFSGDLLKKLPMHLRKKIPNETSRWTPKKKYPGGSSESTAGRTPSGISGRTSASIP